MTSPTTAQSRGSKKHDQTRFGFGPNETPNWHSWQVGRAYGYAEAHRDPLLVRAWHWYEGEVPFFARLWAWCVAIGVPVFGAALLWRALA